jgi:hypothetical protein
VGGAAVGQRAGGAVVDAIEGDLVVLGPGYVASAPGAPPSPRPRAFYWTDHVRELTAAYRAAQRAEERQREERRAWEEATARAAAAQRQADAPAILAARLADAERQLASCGRAGLAGERDRVVVRSLRRHPGGEK